MLITLPGQSSCRAGRSEDLFVSVESILNVRMEEGTDELMNDSPEWRTKELVDFLRGPILSSPIRIDLCLALEGPLLELIGVSRSWEGRAELAELEAVPTILMWFWKIEMNPEHILQMPAEFFESLLLLAKLTRNLCAGNSSNQEAFLHGSGVAVVASIMAKLSSSVHLSRDSLGVSHALPETYSAMVEQASARLIGLDVSSVPSMAVSGAMDCLPMMVQLLGNYSQYGDASQSAVWEEFFPAEFARLAALNSTKMSGPLCMVVYTCCQASVERSRQLCRGDGAELFARLLLLTSDVNSDAYSRTVDASSSGEEFKWFALLVERLCIEESLFPLLFTSMDDLPPSSELDHLNQGMGEMLKSCQEWLATSRLASIQAGLLLILCDRLTLISRSSDSAESSSRSHEVGQGGARKFPMPQESMCFLVDILRQAARRAANDMELHPVIKAMSLASTQVLKATLSLLRIVCSWDTAPGAHREITTSLLLHGLIELLMGMLAALGPPHAVAGGSTHDLHVENRHGLDVECFPRTDLYEGYRRDIVAVIANQAHGNLLVQEQVRQNGHLLLMLQQCMVDGRNPFLREWSLWAMRNLLVGNVENQLVIEDLEAKMAVNLPELSDMGIDVEIDPSTGRPRLVNKAP